MKILVHLLFIGVEPFETGIYLVVVVRNVLFYKKSPVPSSFVWVTRTEGVGHV